MIRTEREAANVGTTKNIQAIERAFSIMELFSKTNCTELGIKEISDMLSLNKSTTFGLIHTLANLGYLQQNPSNQKYALSLKCLRFADMVNNQNAITRAIHPFLAQIEREYGETTHCAVDHGDSIIYIDKVEAVNTSIYISTKIGSQNDFHCTGVGKCILAYLPQERQKQILSKELKRKTPNTITDPKQLQSELQTILENGYAMDKEEIYLGLSCVSVPIFSNPNTVGCAISVSSTTQRISLACENGLIDRLKQASVQISKAVFSYENPSS